MSVLCAAPLGTDVWQRNVVGGYLGSVTILQLVAAQTRMHEKGSLGQDFVTLGRAELLRVVSVDCRWFIGPPELRGTTAVDIWKELIQCREAYQIRG